MSIGNLKEKISSIRCTLEDLESEIDEMNEIRGLPAVAPSLKIVARGETPVWIREAKEHVGIDEEHDEAEVLQFGRDAGTPIDSSETPWCAIFVNAMLARCKIKTTGTMRARDFAEWGQPCDEQEGAIVVYKSHVGFVPEKGKVLGGNQSDGVNIGEQRWYGTPIAYRWPEEYRLNV